MGGARRSVRGPNQPQGTVELMKRLFSNPLPPASCLALTGYVLTCRALVESTRQKTRRCHGQTRPSAADLKPPKVRSELTDRPTHFSQMTDLQRRHSSNKT